MVMLLRLNSLTFSRTQIGEHPRKMGKNKVITITTMKYIYVVGYIRNNKINFYINTGLEYKYVWKISI